MARNTWLLEKCCPQIAQIAQILFLTKAARTEHRLSVCAASGIGFRGIIVADNMSTGRTGNMPVFRLIWPPLNSVRCLLSPERVLMIKFLQLHIELRMFLLQGL